MTPQKSVVVLSNWLPNHQVDEGEEVEGLGKNKGIINFVQEQVANINCMEED